MVGVRNGRLAVVESGPGSPLKEGYEVQLINEVPIPEYTTPNATPTIDDLNAVLRKDPNTVVVRCNGYVPEGEPDRRAVRFDLDPGAGYTLCEFEDVMMFHMCYNFSYSEQLEFDCKLAVQLAYAITVDIAATQYGCRDPYLQEQKDGKTPALQPGPLEAELCCRVTRFLADVFERFRLLSAGTRTIDKERAASLACLYDGPSPTSLDDMIDRGTRSWPDAYQRVLKKHCEPLSTRYFNDHFFIDRRRQRK